MNEDLISDLQKRFHENDNRVGDPSVVQWNLPCKIYMYEFAFKYTVFPRIVVCKKDPMKMRLTENDNRVGILVLKLLFNEIFLTKFTSMNLLLSIGNYNCKYCSTESSLPNLHEWIRF